MRGHLRDDLLHIAHRLNTGLYTNSTDINSLSNQPSGVGQIYDETASLQELDHGFTVESPLSTTVPDKLALEDEGAVPRLSGIKASVIRSPPLPSLVLSRRLDRAIGV